MVDESIGVAANRLAPAKGQLIHGGRGENVGAVEVRQSALITPGPRVGRGARVSRAEAAAGRRTDRIDRLIVDGF